MTRPITRAAHGLVDYAYVVALVAAPFLFGFATVANASIPMWILAGLVLGVTFFTRFEFGVRRVLPYRLHLASDVVGNVFLVAAPFLLGFVDVPAARNAFLGFAALGFVAVALSQTDEMGQVRSQIA